MGKHSTCKGSLYTPKGGRFLPLHGSLCFYALRAFLPSLPGWPVVPRRSADLKIKTSNVTGMAVPDVQALQDTPHQLAYNIGPIV